MSKKNYLVVMAGGIGSRFWPFSRATFPKQFHDVLGTGKSLLQMTISRFGDLIPTENVLVVTNKGYYEQVKSQLPYLDDHQILLEPSGKNTGPCIAYAAYKIGEKNPEASIIVSPSDHFIADIDNFRNEIEEGLSIIEKEDVLLTLGIKPNRPDTGYGYIQYLEQKLGKANKVKTFTEKPNLELARNFLESGDFVWNSGIFLWRVSTIKKAFEEFEPEIHEIFSEGKGQYHTDQEEKFISQAYSSCKSISIDYAVMEKAQNVYTLLSDFGWSDLGTWKSLYETSDKTDESNVVDGNVILKETSNSIVKSSDKDKLIVVNGLNSFIVAYHDNVFMVCPKDEEAKVKEFVAQLKRQDRNEYL